MKHALIFKKKGEINLTKKYIQQMELCIYLEVNPNYLNTLEILNIFPIDLVKIVTSYCNLNYQVKCIRKFIENEYGSDFDNCANWIYFASTYNDKYVKYDKDVKDWIKLL